MKNIFAQLELYIISTHLFHKINEEEGKKKNQLKKEYLNHSKPFIGAAPSEFYTICSYPFLTLFLLPILKKNTKKQYVNYSNAPR